MKSKLVGIISIGFIIFGILLLYYGATVLVNKNVLVGDEQYHYDQILRFVRGIKELNPSITTIPGYNFLIAVIIKLLNNQSYYFIRLVSLVVNLTLIPVLYFTTRSFDKRNTFFKTAGFLFFPILFPYIVLMYTDTLSLSLVLLSVFLANKRKNFLSQIVMISSIFIRQNNIIWLLFINFYIYFLENGGTLNNKKVIIHLGKSLLSIVGICVFAVFILYKGSVSMIGGQLHFGAVTNGGNLYFLLFTYFFLFFPECIAKAKEVYKFVLEKKYILGLWLLFILFFTVFFQNTHIFNQSDFYLRNRILTLVSGNIILKIMFAVICFYSLLSLLLGGLRIRDKVLLYIFTLISIVPVPLIEQRYYLIFFALYFLMRKKVNYNFELITYAYWIVLSLLFFRGIILDGKYLL